MIPLRPANASGANGLSGIRSLVPFPSSAFNLSVNIRHYSYSYYIQRILLQGTAKVPARRLIKLGEQYRHRPDAELKQLEIQRAKRIFPLSFSTMCALRA
jgi:hypothetical protein